MSRLTGGRRLSVTDGQRADDEASDQSALGVQAESAPQDGQAYPPHKRRWWDRRSVHALRREALADRAVWADWDRRANEETRLPLGEEVQLGGLVLAEAFTPSTVSSLAKGLEGCGIRKELHVRQLRAQDLRTYLNGRADRRVMPSHP